MEKEFRVYLRALEIDDYKTTFKWRTNPKIQYGFSEKKVFVSSENERKWIETVINDFSRISLGICLKENNQLIGLSFIKNINMHNRSAETASLIGEDDFMGKGLATEAKMLSLNHAFIDLGLNRVWTNINSNNISSIKMCEKCGYVKEGILRQAKYFKGTFIDVCYYAVLREDFLKIWETNSDV